MLHSLATAVGLKDKLIQDTQAEFIEQAKKLAALKEYFAKNSPQPNGKAFFDHKVVKAKDKMVSLTGASVLAYDDVAEAAKVDQPAAAVAPVEPTGNVVDAKAVVVAKPVATNALPSLAVQRAKAHMASQEVTANLQADVKVEIARNKQPLVELETLLDAEAPNVDLSLIHI